MDELMDQFVVEARERLQAAFDDLLVLEVEPENAERVNGVFRAIHTLKGSVALFDLPVLHSVLHRAENNLEAVRSGVRILDGKQIDDIIVVLEWVSTCIDEFERDGTVGPRLLEVAGRFDETLDETHHSRQETGFSTLPSPAAWARALAAKVDATCTTALRYRPHPECYFNGDDPLALLSRVPLIRYLAVSPRDPWPAPELYDTFRANLEFAALSGAAVQDVMEIFRLVPDQVEIVSLGAEWQSRQIESSQPQKSDAPRSLRIDAARLDALLRTVCELVTVKNGLGRLIASAETLGGNADLTRAMMAAQKQLDRVVGTLYGETLQTRMVPIGQAFRRLPRLVHDLSRRLGKPAELVVVGDAIEADKAIVDQLFEPLLHLVRNAMDHGIEAPVERMAARKPATAKLLLRIAQRGEQIVISVSDDGRGIDPDAIRARAARSGLLGVGEAARLDDRAALDLLFVAGFSTAAEVSDLSGRGVGLDAVRAEISRIGGTVQISSRVGEGTTFTLSLPASFAMTRLLLVSVAGEQYGLPMNDISETVRVNREDIVPVRGNRALVLRNRVIPLLSLASLLGRPVEAEEQLRLTILVLTLGDDLVGVMVDAIGERAEVITKPLDGMLTGARGIAGTTLLENGEIVLVLDLAELVQ